MRQLLSLMSLCGEQNRLPRASLETRQSSGEDTLGAELHATLASTAVDVQRRKRRGDADPLKLE